MSEKKSYKLENINDIKDFFEAYDTFIFDCDGVIWRANNLIKGVKEALTLMKKNVYVYPFCFCRFFKL